MFEQIKGAMSLLVLSKEGIYAARDKSGKTTLVVGRDKDSLVITSETCALPNLGF